MRGKQPTWWERAVADLYQLMVIATRANGRPINPMEKAHIRRTSPSKSSQEFGPMDFWTGEAGPATMTLQYTKASFTRTWGRAKVESNM